MPNAQTLTQMSSPLRKVQHVLNNLGPYVTCLIVCFWVVMIFMVISIPAGDYGVFISVAERLKAGDHLYSEVWDNKDPLFYYGLAISRWRTPLGSWFFDVIRLGLVAIGAFFLARKSNINFQTAAVIGFVCAPIIATAVTDPATSTLPGLGTAFIAIAMLLGKRFFWAGIFISVTFFLKITLFPVVLAAAIVLLFAFAGVKVLKFLLGGLISLALMTILLLIRGEFIPYIDSLKLNFQYSQVDQQTSFLQGIIHHLDSALPFSAKVSIAAIVILIVLAAALNPSVLSHKRNQVGNALWLGTIASLLMIFPVLALTGKWPGHGKLLIFPAVLALIMFSSQLLNFFRRDSVRGVAVLLLCAFVLAGLPTVAAYKTKLEYARANISALTSTPVETQEILSASPPTTYARVGQGDDGGHAFGLQDWKLACPRFHQYWWESVDILESSLDCLPSAQVILVASSANNAVTTDRWAQYLSNVDELLKRDYTCKPINYDRICVRK